MDGEQERIVYEFGAFRIDARQRLLRDDNDAAVQLAPRAFEMLLYFVEHSGCLIEKSALMQAIWPNVIVEDNNLSQHISTLRRKLGDGEGQRYIVTVPGRGYRFVAEVRKTAPAATQLEPLPHAPRTSVAVLPFANLTGEPDKEYFSDGMAEELIHMLTRVPGLKVSARTSSFAYKGRNTDVRQIARDLNVQAVIEGSVRSAGERIRVTVQLVDGQSGYHAWSKSFDRELVDLFKLQDEIASAIAQAMQPDSASGLSALARTQSTHDLAAYSAYLQASSVFSRQTAPNSQRAIELLRQATSLDRGFVRAYSLLAFVHVLAFVRAYRSVEALREAQLAAEQALALDGRSTEASAVLGLVHTTFGHWCEAEDYFQAAFARGTEDSMTYRARMQNLIATGRLRDAIQVSERACELAPAEAQNAMTAAVALGLVERDEEALRWTSMAVDLGLPEHTPPIPNIRTQAARRHGSYGEAVEQVLLLLPADIRGAGADVLVTRIHDAIANRGQRSAGIAALQELHRITGDKPVAGTMMNFLVLWATLLGSFDTAFDLANRMIDRFEQEGAIRGTLGPLWLPEMLPFRRDPRFQGIVRRLGFMEYWTKHGLPDGCELRGGELVWH
jgi:TolB-like protein